MSTPSPIENLPAQLATLAGKIPAAGRLITAASVDSWTLPPGRAQVTYLRAARITLRLYFAKSGTTTILFIFRKETGRWVMLEAVVSLALRAASAAEPARVLAVEDIRRLIRVPSFLWLDVTEDAVATFGPPGATPENTVFFRLGDGGRDILAIRNPEAGKKATLRYSPGGVPGQVEPRDGKYSLRAFVNMTRTLRDWLAQDRPALLTLESVGPPADDTTVNRILTKLLQAYVDSSNAQVAADPPDDAPLPLRQFYRIASYVVTLKLRLKADGTLAQKEKEEQFQLAADMALSDDPTPSATVTLDPPDFLVSGPLYDAFFGELGTPTTLAAIARAMKTDAGFLRPFFTSARPASAIFRVDRSADSDTNILMLTGQLLGAPATVIIQARFRVNAKKEHPTVELLDSEPQVISMQGEDPGGFQIGFTYVEYFLLLARINWLWVGALARW